MNAEDHWGCPDWRDASAYPESASELEDWQWKWEFLRRTPEYRAYWTNLPKYTGPKIGRAWPSYEVRTPPPENAPEVATRYQMNLLPDPRARSLRSDNFYDVFAQPLPFTYVEDILAMSSEEKDKFLISLAQSQHWPKRSSDGVTKDSIYFFSVDISRSLDIQFARLKQELMRLQSRDHSEVEQFKKRRDNWPLWLRVIDAWGQEPNLKLEEFWDALMKESHFHSEYVDVNQPRARVKQWRKAASDVMEKAARLL